MEIDNHQLLAKTLPQLNESLRNQILATSSIAEIPKDSEILREGQYVKVIPIVIDGLIKVFTRHSDKELLLYYIKPEESCVMSFASSLKNDPSKVFAKTEEDTKALLIPVSDLTELRRNHPDLNILFFDQFNLRYAELLDTIHHVLFDKLDKRLMDYLIEKSELTKKNPLKISHRQIAAELGTAREVVSRVIKKLETEGKLIQHQSTIEIVHSGD